MRRLCGDLPCLSHPKSVRKFNENDNEACIVMKRQRLWSNNSIDITVTDNRNGLRNRNLNHKELI